MKTTNTINNATNNTTATYNFPPCSPEEFLDTINMKRGDTHRNWEIVNNWTWEQRFAYYERCVNQPREERKSPWEAVIERCVEKLCLGKVFEVFYSISDEMEPIAVVASKRKKDGTINPKDIHTIVHYTPGDIEVRDIAMMSEYSRIVEETYGIHPRLLIVGKEFDNTVLQAIMAFGRDFSIFAKKKRLINQHTILYIQKGKLTMKTTNMNNNNASVEATTSENIYIATKVRTDVWEERTEIKITAVECSSMATITEMYAKNNELSYVVENLATGEQRTYDGNEICEWCTSQTLESMVDYRITYTGVWDASLYLGKDVFTNEVYFARVKRCDLPSEVVHPLWLLEVSNADTNEVVACNWFETSGAMLAWVDKQILDWRYTEAGIVNHRIYANGYDITPNFRARDRKRYTLSACSRYRSGIDITIDTYCYPSVAKKGKKKFVCSICGEEHFVEEGTFLPHPVRPNKDSDGRYNYCCAACYEKYVGPMHAACWVTSSWRENIERINNIHISVGEGRFYKLSVSELDTIIRLEKLRKEGMSYLRLYEHRDAERESIKLRNKSQSRRMQAVRAAKQAKKTK